MNQTRKLLDFVVSRDKVVFPYQIVKFSVDGDGIQNYIDDKTLFGFAFVEQDSSKGKNNDDPNNQSKNSLTNKSIDTKYSEYGTIMKIFRRDKELIISQQQEVNTTVLTAIGLFRCKILSKSDKFHRKAEVEVLRDQTNPAEENSLIENGKNDLLKESALFILNKQASASMNVSLNNLIMNEENQHRLCYIVISKLDFTYNEKLEMLSINSQTSKVDHLLRLMEMYSIKKMKIPNNNSLDKNGKSMSPKPWELPLKYKNSYKEEKVGILPFSFDLTNVSDVNKIDNYVRNSIDPKQLSNKVRKTILDEIQKIKRSLSGGMGMMSNSDSNNLNYVETLLKMPWGITTEDRKDLMYARKVLDEDHSSLEKVKKRVIEFLAVRSQNERSTGSILCQYGPPGVGKTSLGKSVARALNRKFERVSLGGVTGNSALRGHRRTYVGSYCGQIAQAILRVGSENPVILLDEIDKLGGRSIDGDPTAAMLEILDPNQNSTFVDHYQNIPLDLSKVFFIATANDIGTIPPPLLDRMEIITLSGYNEYEKNEIGLKFLLPKVVKDSGLPKDAIKIDSSVMGKIINGYTREAGVRGLERGLASICRNVAVDYTTMKQISIQENQEKNEKNQENKSDSSNTTKAKTETENPEKKIPEEKKFEFKPIAITEQKQIEILGNSKYRQQLIKLDQPGIALGLAWTPAGGKILEMETSLSRGTGQLKLTGQLGDVMKESAVTALSWIKANGSKWGINELELLASLGYKSNKELGGASGSNTHYLQQIDVHIHFPAAATPKDGPSAGITICSALVSIFSRRTQKKIAMTGEISLTGRVQPVGGIREKVMGAIGAGVYKVILPEDCKPDYEECDNNVKDQLSVIYASNIDDVLSVVLTDEKFDKSHKDINSDKKSDKRFDNMHKL